MLPVLLSDGLNILSYPPRPPAIEMLFSVPFVFFNGIPTHNALGEAKDICSLIFDCRHKNVLFR
jgi:hypothetical protein